MPALPPFASLPPASLRQQVAPDEWQSHIEAWILLAQAYLELPEPKFNIVTEHADSSVVHFIRSYVHEYSESSSQSLSRSTRLIDLHKLVYLLCHRLLSSKSNPVLLDWSFLSEFSHLFFHVSSIGELLKKAWQSNSVIIERSL